MNNNFENEQILQNDIDVELSKFNWGAFFFNFIWAINNGAWKSFWPTFIIMCILLLLSQIPLLGIIFGILNIIFAVYVGKKGNEWAWYGKSWKSLEEFSAVQKTWGMVSPLGFIFFIFIVPLLIKVTTITISKPFAKAIIDQSENFNKNVISQIVMFPEYKNFQSGADIADYFVNKNIYPRYFTIDGNGVLVDKKGPYKAILTFEKEGGRCSLEYKNCYVIYNIHTTKRLSPVEKTYFDDEGKTQSEHL